jgi:predicted GNAT family N-acyltransferase
LSFTWIEKFDAAQAREVLNLYEKEWWTKGRQYEDVVQMLDGSDLTIGCCTHDGELIGFARVLTDFTFKAFIFDVIVRDDYRGKKLGQEIIDRIIAMAPLKKVTSFELYCPDRLTPFYEKLGFKKSSSNLLIKK